MYLIFLQFAKHIITKGHRRTVFKISILSVPSLMRERRVTGSTLSKSVRLMVWQYNQFICRKLNKMKVLAFQLFILTFGFQSFWVLSFFSPPEWYNDALQVSVIFDTYWERLNYCCLPSLVSADCHKSLPAKVLLLRKLLCGKIS